MINLVQMLMMIHVTLSGAGLYGLLAIFGISIGLGYGLSIPSR